jgi:YHS domain-containing protein
MCVRWRRAGGVAVILALTLTSAYAQSSGTQPTADRQQREATPSVDSHEGRDMSTMAREGSGTSWLPDSSPMFMVHRHNGPWMLMAHDNAFLQYFDESGDRGAHQTGSINWLMGMAERNAGRGQLAFRGMISLEPWTIRACGYPDLLASGELCDGEKIHDRQHPHDLFMELSARYDAPLAGGLRWQLYGGPAAEPALGPVAYPHRVSAMPNPLAPMTHHWFDSTHVSFGVVTGGVYAKRWKVEGSAFNGREPDENRKDFDFGALDSASGRIWFLPTANIALEVSAGHLKEAEAGEGLEPRRDVNKATASATYTRTHQRSVWATTAGWGRNSEEAVGTNALLVETNDTVNDRHSWFGRFEIAQKTPHDLGVPETQQTFVVSKFQGGYARYFSEGVRFKVGIGAAASAGIVPEALRSAYGGRVNPGFAVFLTFRPTMTSFVGFSPGETATMVMVQTAYDPTKLTCPAGFDPAAAPSATYEGQRYYFCSTEDRDKFLTDPAMSLSMMPARR